MKGSRGSSPPIETVEKGTRWYRVYWDGVRPTKFSETKMTDNSWRFSPFEDRSTDHVVQGLYMGDSAMCAMAETVFRKDKNAALIPSEVESRYLCEIITGRDLKVAVLTSEFLLDKIGFDPVQSNDYQSCKKIAKIIYHTKDLNVDGIVFSSYQTEGQNKNLVVFSERVNPSDFRVAPKTKEQIYESRYRIDFILALDKSGRLLSESLRKKVFK